jgi:hypothetical protein
MIEHGDAWSQLAIGAHLSIVAGYLLVPGTALRLIPMRRWVRAAGIGFFLTCAITHLSMVFAPEHHSAGPARTWVFWFMLTNHLVQAVCVWVFVLGLASAIRQAVASHRPARTKRMIVEVHGAGLPHVERRQL